MAGARLDHLLAALSHRLAGVRVQTLATRAGPLHVADTGAPAAGSSRPCIVLTPDGPNVVAHYAELIGVLAPHYRVVCFDMPGFGHSLPGPRYRHSLDEGADAVLALLEALDIWRATLAFSCANGLYALRAAQRSPRVAGLILTQTPSLPAMQAWAYRMIPRPLRVPVLGQALAWMARRKMAHLWYRSALPPGRDAAFLQQAASASFAQGGCFCLASVVQGLLKEDQLLQRTPNLPCTLVWGTQDRSHRATPPDSLQQLLQQAELIRFDDCGHFPDLEQPGRYAAVVLAHMSKHDPYQG